MPQKTVTVRRLAELCQVSKSTVAMALRNDPRIAAPTRKRIRKAAAKQGYAPDPRISHLMSLLKRKRREPIWNVAWLNSAALEDAWTRLPWFARYLKGAERQALALGYDIDHLWIEEQTPLQLARVLQARGIHGLLIPFPERPAFWTRFPWNQFSAVVVDEWEVRLSLPRVRSDRHCNMRLLLARLHAEGYRRPALWLQRRVDEISDEAYTGAFLGWHFRHSTDKPLVWLFEEPDSRTLLQNIRRHQPDVVICSHNQTKELLETGGYSVPGSLAVVHLNLASDVPAWSGIDQRHEAIGAAAMDVLNTLLLGGQTGIPAHPQTISLPGTWKQGVTSTAKTLKSSVRL